MATDRALRCWEQRSLAHQRKHLGKLQQCITMALKVCGKLRLKKLYIVAFLSLLTLSAVMINTYSPFPLKQVGLPSEGPYHNKPTGLVKGKSMPFPNINSGTWKHSKINDLTTNTRLIDHDQHSGNKVKKHVTTVAPNKTRKSFKRPKRGSFPGWKKQRSRKFTANTKGMLGKEPGNSNNSKYSLQHFLPRHDQTITQSASVCPLHPDIKPCRYKCTPDGPKPEQLMENVNVRLHVELKQASRTFKMYKRQLSEKKRHHSVVKNNHMPWLADGSSTNWCQPLQSEHFNWNVTRVESLPWFSHDDVEKINLLARGTVLSKARLSGHGQVLQVGLGDPIDVATSSGGDHSKLCQTKRCALIKRPNDWIEVFAFHLDRVLGLNRSLPAILRTFHSDILPYKFTSGSSRPMVWWDPDIQHLPEKDNDQNSFSLTWPQYQALLKARCGIQVSVNSSECVGVHHSEWGRLALFDFLLQVNDRLDRHCCGFQPDPSDICVENLLNVKCVNPDDLMLVHILVRSTDPSRLVFIDNAGRPDQPHDNLNFRLIEGIDMFPQRAVSVLRSGCLEQLLLYSLSADKVLWENRGGADGLKATIHTIQHRAKILLQHIQGKRQ